VASGRYSGELRWAPIERADNHSPSYLSGYQLTPREQHAALQLLQCEYISMSDLVDRILKAYGREVGSDSRAKISHYLQTLTSAGTRDSQQLLTYGLAYVDHLHNPDPRYTGC
jgi:hypothetical protein